ncbi:hypothetical protein NMY22_g18486 [Coprinellus aureogranulatus]|nr:hypothetical protein NMY22_g18486 [Coprinellus aureogranulatus]
MSTVSIWLESLSTLVIVSKRIGGPAFTWDVSGPYTWSTNEFRGSNSHLIFTQQGGSYFVLLPIIMNYPRKRKALHKPLDIDHYSPLRQLVYDLEHIKDAVANDRHVAARRLCTELMANHQDNIWHLVSDQVKGSPSGQAVLAMFLGAAQFIGHPVKEICEDPSFLGDAVTPIDLWPCEISFPASLAEAIEEYPELKRELDYLPTFIRTPEKPSESDREEDDEYSAVTESQASSPKIPSDEVVSADAASDDEHKADRDSEPDGEIQRNKSLDLPRLAKRKAESEEVEQQPPSQRVKMDQAPAHDGPSPFSLERCADVVGEAGLRLVRLPLTQANPTEPQHLLHHSPQPSPPTPAYQSTHDHLKAELVAVFTREAGVITQPSLSSSPVIDNVVNTLVQLHRTCGDMVSARDAVSRALASTEAMYQEQSALLLDLLRTRPETSDRSGPHCGGPGVEVPLYPRLGLHTQLEFVV